MSHATRNAAVRGQFYPHDCTKVEAYFKEFTSKFSKDHNTRRDTRHCTKSCHSTSCRLYIQWIYSQFCLRVFKKSKSQTTYHHRSQPSPLLSGYFGKLL